MFCGRLVALKGQRPRTIDGHRRALQRFLAFAPDIVECRQVTPLLAERFFYWGREEHGWTPSTFLTYHKRLNVFFAWTSANGLAPQNPFEKIEKPKLRSSLPKRIKKEDALRLLATAAALPVKDPFVGIRNHAVIATFLFAGLRKTELLRLNVGDVDLGDRVIYVRDGKGGKDRLIPVADRLAASLARYSQARAKRRKTCPEFFVSADHNKVLAEETLKRLVERLRTATQIDFHLHMLRHTFATLMLEGGCDIYSLAKMMGHGDIKTTTIYLSASVEHLRGQIFRHPLNASL